MDDLESATVEDHQAEKLLVVERDLSLAISATSSLNEVLDLLLTATCRIDGLDCGGVYLVDRGAGEFHLAAHMGLSPEFVQRSSHYSADSDHARLVAAGKPVYAVSPEFPPIDLELREGEGLRAIAAIPVMLRGEVVAVLNLASRTHDEIMLSTRAAIEGMATQIAGSLARVTAEEALREELSFRAAVVDHAAEGFCVCHQTPEFPYVRFTVWNDQMREITGYTMEEINRCGWYQTMYPDPEVSERARLRMEGMRHGDDIRAEEWEVSHADGRARTFSISTSILKDDGGTPHVLAMILDVTDRRRATAIIERHQQVLEETVAQRTAELQKANETLNLEIGERKRTEAELHELATRDSLTGALTRRRFFDLAEQARKETRRYGHSLAVLMIDVDDFKAINDELGHAVGDETLVNLVEVIRRHVREVDILGRYGGDELVILMPQTDEKAAVCTAERLCGVVRDSTLVGRHETAPVTVSIGVAVIDTEGDESIDGLVLRADGAMYRAKQDGRDRVRCWTPAIGAGRAARK